MGSLCVATSPNLESFKHASSTEGGPTTVPQWSPRMPTRALFRLGTLLLSWIWWRIPSSFSGVMPTTAQPHEEELPLPPSSTARETCPATSHRRHTNPAVTTLASRSDSKSSEMARTAALIRPPEIPSPSGLGFAFKASGESWTHLTYRISTLTCRRTLLSHPSYAP